nr:hypothetical protein HK105_004158 [Polyrhizophydium stewartii]
MGDTGGSSDGGGEWESVLAELAKDSAADAPAERTGASRAATGLLVAGAAAAALVGITGPFLVSALNQRIPWQQTTGEKTRVLLDRLARVWGETGGAWHGPPQHLARHPPRQLKFVDMGSGDGCVVLAAASFGRPPRRWSLSPEPMKPAPFVFGPCVGIESNFTLWAWSLAAARLWHWMPPSRVRFLKQDFWKVDVRDADVVMVFGVPAFMVREEPAHTGKMGDDFDVDKFLRLESNEFNQIQEVERILALCPPDAADEAKPTEATVDSLTPTNPPANPVDVLDMPVSLYVTCDIQDRAVKMQFRKRSLLVHPDKCPHPRAQEAFDALKKAEAAIMDTEKRRALLGHMFEARALVFDRHKLPVPKVHTPEAPHVAADAAPVAEPLPVSDPVAADELLRKFPKLGYEIQSQLHKLMYELLNRDRLRLKNDKERQMQKEQREYLERKQKYEEKKEWEEKRDSRVESWRKFQSGTVKKKQKQKKNDEIQRQQAQAAVAAAAAAAAAVSLKGDKGSDTPDARELRASNASAESKDARKPAAASASPASPAKPAAASAAPATAPPAASGHALAPGFSAPGGGTSAMAANRSISAAPPLPRPAQPYSQAPAYGGYAGHPGAFGQPPVPAMPPHMPPPAGAYGQYGAPMGQPPHMHPQRMPQMPPPPYGYAAPGAPPPGYGYPPHGQGGYYQGYGGR